MESTEEQRLRWRANKTRWRRANPEKNRAIVKRYRTKNKEKISQKLHKYYELNKYKWENRDLVARRKCVVSKHGLTLEDYDKLYEAQNGLCATCYQPETRKHKNGKVMALVVDHSHETSEIRGLLCHACNASLGLTKENVDTLNNMILYLKKSKGG